MRYPRIPKYRRLIEQIESYTRVKSEYGANSSDLRAPLARAHRALKDALSAVRQVPIDRAQAAREPANLARIRRLRPKGPRRLWTSFDSKKYAERVEGALLARMAGCTLGAIVEGWGVKDMERWAKQIGDPFPPTDYWSQARTPTSIRYIVSPCQAYTRDGMDGVPVDDDLIYTYLGLLLFEKHGADFTTEDVGRMWHEYLPWIYKDMQWPLDRWLAGTAAEKAAEGNPYAQLICAGIRCDPFGYVAPGQPEKAAALAHREGLMSHRRNGLYGGIFFAATISAAFAVDHPAEAIRIGLTEIPKGCRLAKDIRWALRTGKEVEDYRDARAAVDERFKGMETAHTLNNACLTVFGLLLGGTDVTQVLSQTVAMGLDNDCTAATAGSIVGAVVGERGVPKHWYRKFNNKVHSYIKDHRRFSISGLVRRYTKQARRFFT
jgi:ADP-ribosylglycohydrolase